jgi:hypothetical protein
MDLQRKGKTALVTGASTDTGPDHQHHRQERTQTPQRCRSAKAGIHAWANGLSREVGQFGIARRRSQ